VGLFGRMSWALTFFIPVGLGIAVALWGLNSSLPRIFFIISFIFVLVILPGIFILLKILGTPLEEEEVTLVGTTARNQVRLMQPSGDINSVSDGSLLNAVRGGLVQPGTKLRIIRRGDIIASWKPLKASDTEIE